MNGISDDGEGDSPDKTKTAYQLHDLLDQSVAVHLRSDVDLGVCLSGGLDSSTVVALASRHTQPVRTFTTYFDEGPEFDERVYADEINGRFKTESFQLKIDNSHFLDTLKLFSRRK